MSERPSDAMQPSSKRRPGGQLTKDDMDDEEDGPGYDPGSWAQGNKASTDTIAKRKIIKVRRGGAAAPEAEAAEATGQEAAAPAVNPFAGIALPGADAAAAATAAAPAASYPAGVSLTAAAPAEGAKEGAASSDKASEQPAAATASEGKQEEAPKQPDAQAEAPPVEPAPAAAAPTPAAGGFGSLAASTGGCGFGGFGGGGFGGLTSAAGGTTGGFGGFGGLAAGGAAGGGFSAAAATGGAPLFSFSTAGASKPAGEGEDGEDGAGPDAEADAPAGVFSEPPPVVTLDEVPKMTGEEDEAPLFRADGALYEWHENAWRERGKGEFRLNLNQAGKARMVMRQRGTSKLLLNAALFPGMVTAVMAGGGGVTFGVSNAAAGGEGEQAEGGAAGEGALDLRTYGLRIKKKALVDELLAVVEVHKGKAGEGGAAAAGGGAAAAEAGGAAAEAATATNGQAGDAADNV